MGTPELILGGAQPDLDALDRLARPLARVRDFEHIGGAERGPDLLAVRIARDSDVDARSLRRDPHVVAAHLGIRYRVAFAPAWQRRYHLVGENLAALAADHVLRGDVVWI